MSVRGASYNTSLLTTCCQSGYDTRVTWSRTVRLIFEVIALCYVTIDSSVQVYFYSILCEINRLTKFKKTGLWKWYSYTIAVIQALVVTLSVFNSMKKSQTPTNKSGSGCRCGDQQRDADGHNKRQHVHTNIALCFYNQQQLMHKYAVNAYYSRIPRTL